MSASAATAIISTAAHIDRGGSPVPTEPYVDAEDGAELLDHLGIDRATVVGSSYGGRVALELAAAHRERVAGLFLLSPAFRGLPPTAAA